MGITQLTKQAKLALTLERVNQSLLFRVPWRRRRQIIKELRANLAEASAAQGTDAAIENLGSIRTLVDEYLDAERGRLDVATGLIAMFTVWLAVSIVMFLAMVFASDAYEAAGGTGHYVHTYLGALTVDIDNASEPKSFGVGTEGPIWPIISIVAFAIGSKAWRVLPRFRSASAA